MQANHWSLLWIGFLVFGLFWIGGCFHQSGFVPTENRTEIQVPEESGVLGDSDSFTVFDQLGKTVSDQKVTGELKGVLVEPISGEVLAFIQDEEVWAVWMYGTEDRLVYSTRVPFSACEITRNGVWLSCIQEGEVYVIRLKDGWAKRVDVGVLSIAWSPNSSDLLLQYPDRMELVSVNSEGKLGPHTQVSEVSGEGAVFIQPGQVVWWTGTSEVRQLELSVLRNKNNQALWTGRVEEPNGLVNQTGELFAFGTGVCTEDCQTQILDLTTGLITNAIQGSFPAAWLGSEVVVKTPLESIDPQAESLYHFSVVNSEGLFLATRSTLQIDFQ